MAAATKRPLPRSQLRLGPGESLCDHCVAKCCRYFAVVVEAPRTRADLDLFRWYLLHEGVTIFTEGGGWYLLVFNECRELLPDNRCGVYATRPQICRDYSTADCEYDEDCVYDKYFETPEQVQEYADALFPPATGHGIRSAPPPLLPVLG